MNEYISKWPNSELHRFDQNRMEQLGIDKKQVDFLANTGLPREAAPLLSFDNETNLHTIQEIYGLEGESHNYRIQIGFDGCGDTLCIDKSRQNKIVSCDHESNFEPRFMNTSVIELFKFLTLMKSFGEFLQAERGEDAYMNCEFTDQEFQNLIQELQSVDSLAVEDGTFWREELDRLLEDRDYYQNEK